MTIRIAAAFLFGACFMADASAADIGFVEEFALAKDRAETLKKLVPGTEDYYYYHALHYQHAEQFARVPPLFKPWGDRFGQTARLTEIQTRQALLTYEKDPQATLAYFKSRLGLAFGQQKDVPGGSPALPTALDPKLIARETLAARAANRWRQGSDGYEDAALEWLLTPGTEPNLRRHILTRLVRPDVAELPKIVNDDLGTEHSGGFGSLPIHKLLTLAQLDDLRALRPALLNQSNYVHAYLARLHPGDDADWRRDPVLTRAYLDRLLGFARQLAPVHNGLKAHVLYHRLALDQSEGKFDKALFLEYLALPRFQGYMAKAMRESAELRRQPADLNANWTGATLLPVVGGDEALVRAYLKHFLLDAASPKEYEPFIDDAYLKHLFAETKIENGLGEPEAWAAGLPPELFARLRERIDIDFAPTNKTNFAAGEAVSLELFVKNAPAVMVKVFEINALNYYRTQKREVDTAINLDGLVANAERTLTFAETPFRRVSRKVEFPELSKPGVYVVDFIGAGKSSRALIRKGRLRPVVGASTAGQKVTVVDEANAVVPGAVVWLNGQEFKADEKGAALVPFSTAPGRRPIVLSTGAFASLDFLDHAAENYALAAGIHVDREALLTQRIAALIVRPGLKLNGLPVAVGLLEQVKFLVVATDADGIATSTEVPEFKLFEDRESVYEFRVPARLAKLSVTLRAKVKSLSLGREIDLEVPATFALNGISKTDRIEDLHLAKFGADYAVELRGLTGEPRADRPVRLVLKHREFTETIDVSLKSDAAGRIALGPLGDIAYLTATGPEGTAHTWYLPVDRQTHLAAINARLGEAIAVPYAGAVQRSEVALFELRGDAIAADRFANLSQKEGAVEITGLPAGDFDLWLKGTGEKVRLRIADGPVAAGAVLGKLRHLQLPGLKPVAIASVDTDAESVTVKLRGATKFARVHVYATRYLPAYDAYADLAKVRGAELAGTYPIGAESLYLSGRNIGDEYRYVLDRRNRVKRPGNMLERPALLLNPWVLRDTETGEQVAEAGEEYRRELRSTGGGSVPAPAASKPMNTNQFGRGSLQFGNGSPTSQITSNLDFLYDPSAAILNLVPDKDGVIKIARKDFGPHSLIRIVVVDPLNTAERTFALPEQKALFADLRLKNGLDPKLHFTQQKQVDVLPAGKPFTIADAAGSRFETYDSLAKVYGLYATLSNDPKLAEFAFVLNWPKLKIEEKRTLYSKFACHELNFFLFRKDPEFFAAVIKPYLANKRDKTFLDRWLLEEDVKEFLDPWKYSRLNTVERALLARRIPGEPDKTVRHLNELLRLLPADADRGRMLFETAVKAGELGLENRLRNGERGEGFDATIEAATKGAKEAGINVESPSLAGAAMPAFPNGGGRRMSGDAKKKAESEVLDMNSLKDEDPSQKRDGKPAADKEAKGEQYFEDDRKQRKDLDSLKRLYRVLDPTHELAENNYYKLPIGQQVAKLVGVSAFWVDYANHKNGPFLSPHLADASRSFPEMMFALAILDLPFAAAKADSKYDGGKLTYTPAGPTLAFHEEVKPVAGPGDKVQILVSQNFYRAGDRYRDEAGERSDKFVAKEFVVETVYGCQIVVTNPTPSRQRLNVLVQLPVGALPVQNGQQTKSIPLDLEPYRTGLVDYLFYFPFPGQYAHFPAHVAKGETLVAAAAPFAFNVVAKATAADTESWDYVSQNGTDEQVIAYLMRESVEALDLDKIAFRMRDRAFFERTLALLRGRHAYRSTLWSFGLYHGDARAAREYLEHADRVAGECGCPIRSPLLTVDPVERHSYQHLEYRPLVNARAHSLGKTRQIVNGSVHAQYHAYLNVLAHKPTLGDDDRLGAAYYLLLQDRLDEAAEFFASVNAGNIPEKMQYDYCAAYLALSAERLPEARAIAIRYANHPVDRWRNAFAAVANQLDEIEGKANRIADKDDQAQQQAKLAALEPNAEFALDAKAIHLTWQNLESVRINYYRMDVELLFSRNPFVRESGNQFAMIRPNETREVSLPKGQSKLDIALPENLVSSNVLVEVVAGGRARSQPHYANAMAVTLAENYGQLQVADAATGKALSKVYVKCYAKLADGTVKFHKDGYTDLRGKFDYASVGTPERAGIVKFGLLVLGETQGALIREAEPPQK